VAASGKAASLRRATPCPAKPPGRLPGKLARSPCRGARRAERHVDLAYEIEIVRARDHRIERLADAGVIWMRPGAEAQARPVAQQLLRALARRPDLGTASHLAGGSNSRADPLEYVSNSQADSPADLRQPVSKLRLPAIAHTPSVSPAATRNQRGTTARQRASCGEQCDATARSRYQVTAACCSHILVSARQPERGPTTRNGLAASRPSRPSQPRG
jgi:hypothetical protein